MSIRKTLTTALSPESAIVAVDRQASDSSRPSSKITFRPRKIRKVSSDLIDSLPKITASPLSIQSNVDLALRHLLSSDEVLGTVISAHNPPVFDSSSPPFLSLARSILYQQLATKAAKCIYDRFLSLFNGGESGVLPEAVTSLSAAQMRQIGVSGRKASYLHDLAEKYTSGVLSDELILEMNDEELINGLTTVKGIGVWSVHMFMIFSLHRPDVLPVGDLGVRKGVKDLYGLKDLPGPLQMEQLCEKWRPYRSIGSWYMWRLIEAKSSKTKL